MKIAIVLVTGLGTALAGRAIAKSMLHKVNITETTVEGIIINECMGLAVGLCAAKVVMHALKTVLEVEIP